MRQRSSTLQAEAPEAAAERGSRAGIVSFAGALALSPLVVCPLLLHADWIAPDAVAVIMVASMVASVAWPATAIWQLSAGRTRGRNWAIAGLTISLVGWGCVLLFAAMLWRAGGMRGIGGY